VGTVVCVLVSAMSGMLLLEVPSSTHLWLDWWPTPTPRSFYSAAAFAGARGGRMAQLARTFQ
jgi:hypothetical protein